MQRVYYQCPLGHYSSGIDGCWFDHWIQPSLPMQMQGDLGAGHGSMTISRLLSAGFPAGALRHVLLLDFGASESAFDGMIPLSFLREPSQVFSGLDGWNPDFPAGFSTVDGTRPVLYFRCNGGHYFSGSASCPLDGWCESGTEDTMTAFSEMISEGVIPRPSDVVRGAATQLLRRVIIAQFGDPLRAVRGIVPMIYYHRGRPYLERDLPLELL